MRKVSEYLKDRVWWSKPGEPQEAIWSTLMSGFGILAMIVPIFVIPLVFPTLSLQQKLFDIFLGMVNAGLFVFLSENMFQFQAKIWRCWDDHNLDLELSAVRAGKKTPSEIVDLLLSLKDPRLAGEFATQLKYPKVGNLDHFRELWFSRADISWNGYNPFGY